MALKIGRHFYCIPFKNISISRLRMAKGPKLGIWSYMYRDKLLKITDKISPHSSPEILRKVTLYGVRA